MVDCGANGRQATVQASRGAGNGVDP